MQQTPGRIIRVCVLHTFKCCETKTVNCSRDPYYAQRVYSSCVCGGVFG